ncbi:MAG: energy transducer TonB, partial [Chloroflexota bacterium]
ILAVATPVVFLRSEAAPAKTRVARNRLARAQREAAAAAATAPVAIPDIRPPEPVAEPIAASAPAGAID